MTVEITQAVQSFSPGARVELYVVDLTNLGGGITRWANAAFAANAITFDGEIFTPMQMEVEGFEWNGKGAIPTPSIKIMPNAGIKSAMQTYGDLIGGKITRIVTFSRFLDGQADADPSQKFPDEVYYFEQKVSANKYAIEWRLSSSLDQEGIMIPKGIVLKDVCDKKYRTWNGSSFDYVPVADGGCPYNGASYYDVNGTATTSDKDRCGKRFSECERRFGVKAVLPFGGFPGVTGYRR
jgi:lambda family phage minor tail protein L